MNQQVKDIATVVTEATQLADMLAECDDAVESARLEEELLNSIVVSEMGVDKLYVILKALDGKVNHYKELSRELQQRASIIQTQKDRIQDSIIWMVQKDMLPPKLIGTTYRITACKNSAPSLVLTEEDELELIEKGYKRTKIEVDKRAVLEAIEDGELPGFEDTLHRGMHLRFNK